MLNPVLCQNAAAPLPVSAPSEASCSMLNTKKKCNVSRYNTIQDFKGPLKQGFALHLYKRLMLQVEIGVGLLKDNTQ